MKKFWAGGFLYNPQNYSVFLHKRDGNTKFNPNRWAFFGGLSEGGEKPIDCFIRELSEEIGVNFRKEEVLFLRDYFNEEFQTHRFVFYIISSKDKKHFRLGEGADFDWISLDRLDDYNLTEKTMLDLIFFINYVIEESKSI